MISHSLDFADPFFAGHSSIFNDTIFLYGYWNGLVLNDNFQFLNEWNFRLHKDIGPIATALQLKREEY